MPTAVLIDGGFFIKRFPRCYPKENSNDPKRTAQLIFETALHHLNDKDYPGGRRQLYRIFFYDCPPLEKKVHWPISRQSHDYSRSNTAEFRRKLHDELRSMRKVALRLGHLSDYGEWRLKKEKLKELLHGSVQVSGLTDQDFDYSFRQKCVDMKIGLDIASLSYKKLVDQIILVSGDADFVPAAKLARREGMDFILDPMWNPIPENLNEHVDAVKSVCPNPSYR